jgi:hypothetical protein
MQQWTKLRSQGIANPNPRQQVLDDLTEFIRPHVQAGNEIIVMMDSNDTLESRAMDKFMDDLDLWDLMEDHLPATPPTTYQRGRNKIDHIVGTKGMLLATIRAYVLAFGDETPKSDHAICGIDFSLDNLCGIHADSLHDPTHPSARQLWSTDIKAAEKYVELVERRITEENLEERTKILISRCSKTRKCTEADERIMNEIDQTLTEILLWAESKCKRAHGHAWSPLLANAGRTVIAAKWNLSNIMHGRTPIPPHIQRATAISTAREQVKDAYTILRKVQANAKQIRDSFLEDRAEHLAETQHTTKAAALRQLLAAERSANIFKRLGIWFKGKEYMSMDRILVPDDPTDLQNTTWQTVVEAQALYEVLIKASQEHFRQAANTPFVTGPIANKFGPFADNEYCDAILAGHFDFTEIAEITEVHDLIAGMQYPEPANPTPTINGSISLEEFCEAIAHTRERTSSSPSGRHYGHYRTLLRSENTLAIIASLANFCFQWGVTLSRWEKVTQPMIPKDKGPPRINRIRRITLIEADLNVCLSELFGRRLMENAEKHNILHPSQYGSRQGKMAISAVLLKRISYDHIRQTRQDAIIFDNDATACYDRIIPSLAAIIARRAGMPREAANTLTRLLFRMHYYVRTAYGVAERPFSNLIDWILGVMQGGGHSGGLWALTSSVMIDTMEDTFGAEFHSPYPARECCRRIGEAFVDDTTLWALRLGITFALLIAIMRKTAQRWERLLYATGGALNLLKCFWYGINWEFTAAGAPKMKKIQEDDLPIALTAGADHVTTHEIARIEVTKGMRTLGVRIAPDGNEQEEYKHRMNEATIMRDRLKGAPLNREQVGIGFRAIWKMKMQYPIGSTCFTSKQCTKIQARYLPTFLSRMGINKTTACAVRHGPQSLGGMDVFHLETEQAVQHTKLMVSHIRKKDEVGRMIQNSIDQLQIQAGTSWAVLSKPGKKARMYVDPCYVTHTWEFLDKIGSNIRIEPSTWTRPQRAGDRFIMDDVANIPGIKPIELVYVQRVRLFLGVTTLADISTSCGQALSEWALKATANPRHPIFRFPRQERPRDNKVISTWTRIIRLCYATANSQKLDQPLGTWYKGRINQVWDTVIDPVTDKIYMWHQGHVRVYERRNRSQFRYIRRLRHATFPLHCVPISGSFQSGIFTTSGYSKTSASPTTVSEPLQEMRNMNRGVRQNVISEDIAAAIWQGRAIMGTDGSVKGPIATYSFVISLSKKDVQTNVKGGGFLPPTAQYLTHYSKRPEAAALLAGLSWIAALLDTYPNACNSTPPPLIIPIDNAGVVKDVHRIINDLTPTFDLLSPDYDILQAIRTTLRALPVPTIIEHVKGHQDTTKCWDKLDIRAQINVLADRQADAIYRKPPGRTGLFPTWVPGTGAALFHNDAQVTKGIPEYIREAKHTPEMKRHLIQRSQTARGRDKPWSEEIYSSIDWQHYGETFKKLSVGQRIQTSKYTNDLLPTARRLQVFNNRNDGRCFACQRLWEDTTHVLTCPCEARCQARTAARVIFQQQLTRLHTPDILNKLICDSMDSWMARRPVTLPAWNVREPIQREMRRAFTAQSKIGWDQFLRGRVAKAWQRPIQTYYRLRQPGESFTPEQWMRKLISALWTFSLTMWRQRCSEFHGTESAISLERRRRETATKAQSVYQETIGKVSPSDSIVLHQHSIETILKWTKEHLDAYLTSAAAIIDLREEPG